MTNPRPLRSGVHADATVTPERLLDGLEAAFRRHLDAVDKLTPDQIAELTAQVEQVARALTKAPAASAPAAMARARRVEQLHERLVLAVRQQRAESADRLGHIRKGKATLRAYRQGT